MKMIKRLYLFLFILVLTGMSGESLMAQRIITGNVSDAETSEGLVGASVVVTGTTTGTITDFDGNFELTIPEDAEQLSFSFVGYTSQTIAIDEGDQYDIQLATDEAILEEVIVIGYGTLKKSDKTGAVVAVDADELNQGLISDPIQGLQGKAAGVNISKTGSDPNAGFNVNIRGAASFTAGTGPLYVVDGVVGVDPTTINPDDIESFNVLKDASSTAIYGSRGSNGVIIITTKGANFKGSDVEKRNVHYNGYVSIDKVEKKYDLISASEMRDFAERNNFDFIDNGADVDWQDEVFRTAISHNHSIAFSGSDKNTNYRASLSGNFIDGVLKGSERQRFIGRLNLSQKAIKDRVLFNARLSATFENNDYVKYDAGTLGNNVIYQMLRRSPTDPIYDEDEEEVTFFETDRNFQYFNPLAIINDYQDERAAKRLFGNLKTTVDIYGGLSASFSIAYNRDDEEFFYFEPEFTESSEQGLARREYKNQDQLLLETTVDFVRTFNDKHNVNAVFGYTWQHNTFDGFKVEGRETQSFAVESNNLSTLLDINRNCCSSYKNERYFASYLGRAIYNFDSRYFVTASIRADRDTRLGKNNQWGYFPAVSAAWTIKNEAFLNNVDAISQLKLRVGYGTSGNSDIPIGINDRRFGPQGTAINPETGQTVIDFNTDGGNAPNPDLKWERIGEVNLGLDFGFVNDRISGSIEYYRRKTTDLIYRYEQEVPPNRERNIYANGGEINNDGIEATLQAFPISTKKFSWKTTFALSHNKQNVISLSREGNEIDEIRELFVEGRGLVGGENYTQIIRPGLPLGSFYLPEYAGLSDDGKFLFFTEAGGVTRDVTKAERRLLGQAQPKFVGGWSNYFDLPFGLDINFAFRTMVGHSIINVTRAVFSNPLDLQSLNGLNEAIVEYERGVTSSPIISDYYLEKASFLRLDFAQIGYTIEPLQKKNIGSIRLYLSGTNLFTLTKYSGQDPEVNLGGTAFGRENYNVYPRTRSITFGMNATF